VSINSDDAEQARRLNNEAAKTIRYGGLTDDEALATVTINPAKQLQIDKRVGSLEVGKDADVVIWNHHPLSTEAIVDRAYIDGVVYYDRLKDLDRIAAIEKEKGVTRTTTAGTSGTSAVALSVGAADRLSLIPTTQNAGRAIAGGRTSDKPTYDLSSGLPDTGANVPDPDSRSQAPAGPAWAITNARIVTVSGAVIPRGTIVIRGNKI